MRRILLGFVLGGLLTLTGCAQDPSVYDIKSPCVSVPYGGLFDQPCERRLPLENFDYSNIIATS